MLENCSWSEHTALGVSCAEAPCSTELVISLGVGRAGAAVVTLDPLRWHVLAGLWSSALAPS